MIAPQTPANEAARLDALHALDLLDTPPQPRFDHVTRLARRIFQVPVALITLVDSDRQWFLSRTGLDMQQTTRDVSFCGHAILQEQVMVVEDAAADERFHDNPLVTGSPHVRFYAGAQLQAGDGHHVGTLCLLDVKERQLTDDDLAALRDLADMVSRELASARLASEDALTGLLNRRGFAQLAPCVLAACHQTGQPAGLLYVDLDHFKQINDTHGHAEGDRALRSFAQALRLTCRDEDIVARLAGDEFVALLPAADDMLGAAIAARLSDRLRTLARTENLPYALQCSIGFAAYDPLHHADWHALLAQADQAMFSHKAGQRQHEPASNVLQQAWATAQTQPETVMKTQISYTKLDGGNGLALVDGTVESPLSAKRRLAAALKLPGDVDGDGDNDAVDERLRLGGVDPLSIQTAPASE